MSTPKPHEVKLGQIISDGDSLRDAIHIAVAPLEAAEKLFPGDHIGIDKDGRASKTATPQLGIVDPFLKKKVLMGERFWMMLYPQTITSLRHEWTHETFDKLVKPLSPPEDSRKKASELWLRAYCVAVGQSYETIMEGAAEFLADKSSWSTVGLRYATPDVCYTKAEEFWKHYEIVTGEKIDEGRRKDHFFSCSC